MTEMIDGPLYLAGYVKLAESGFALPAWGAGPGANAWYCAVPTVEGDHSGAIAGFAVLEDEPVTRLAGPALSAGLGSAWQDVFLWNSEAFAGTPREILAALAAYAADIQRVAPLSWLDLSLAADAPDTAALAERARAFLTQRLASGRDARAFCNLVLRPGVLVVVRRLQNRNRGAGEATALCANITAREVGAGLFEVSMPPGIAQALGGQAVADRLDAAVAIFAERLGVSVRVRYETGETRRAEPISFTPTVAGPEPFLAVGPSPDEADVPSITVIAPDRRAGQIARYLNSASTGVGSALGRKADLRPLVEPRIHVADRLSPTEMFAASQVVVCLVTNEMLNDAGFVDQLMSIAEEIGRGRPFLFAPIPPADGPSNLFDGTADKLLARCHGIIDTTLARSPYWSGSSRRSVDRRMADIIATTSAAAAGETGLHRQLLVMPETGPRILSTFFDRATDRDLATISELAGASSSEEDARFVIRVRDLMDDKAHTAIVVLRDARPDFQRLAAAAVMAASGSGLAAVQHTSVPDAVREVIAGPTEAFFARGDHRLVVTAETPDLTALRVGQQSGTQVVRYTDRDALRALFNGEAPFSLPSEIRLPSLRRQARNRGLVTRGVDARDIVRLSPSHWEDLLATSGGSVLENQVRRYRPTLRVAANAVVALPAPAVIDAANAGDRVAQHLAEDMRRHDSRSAGGGKRISDLAAAWSRPSGDGRRWVLEDGQVPVEIASLSIDEVPAQRLFLIDGDAAVPTLLLSRLFAVWARALLPSSTSWSSRFQVGQTFEAFPLTLSFVVTPAHDKSPPQLRFSRQSDAFPELMTLLGLSSTSSKPTLDDLKDVEKRLRDPLVMREVDAILLADVGLRPDADEFDILERLIDQNRSR